MQGPGCAVNDACQASVFRGPSSLDTFQVESWGRGSFRQGWNIHCRDALHLTALCTRRIVHEPSRGLLIAATSPGLQLAPPMLPLTGRLRPALP